MFFFFLNWIWAQIFSFGSVSPFSLAFFPPLVRAGWIPRKALQNQKLYARLLPVFPFQISWFNGVPGILPSCIFLISSPNLRPFLSGWFSLRRWTMPEGWLRRGRWFVPETPFFLLNFFSPLFFWSLDLFLMGKRVASNYSLVAASFFAKLFNGATVVVVHLPSRFPFSTLEQVQANALKYSFPDRPTPKECLMVGDGEHILTVGPLICVF